MRNDPLDRAFTALADHTRRAVIRLLQQRPHRAGELATMLDVSAPALSRHLRVLRESRLVEQQHDPTDGRVSLYCLRREVFTSLRSWVDEVEALWRDQLTAFAQHAADRQGPDQR